MKIFRYLLLQIKKLFGVRIAKRKSKDFSKPEYSLLYVDDLPEESTVREKTVYVVGENGYHWVAAFKCPCGCGDLIQLNLIPEGKHIWRIRMQEESFSIYPSVDRVYSNCRSHFNLTRGNVVWCINS